MTHDVELPVGTAPRPVELPHFPTRQQAFVWRNWGLIPLGRLAGVLGTAPDNVTALARGMGLPADPVVNPHWLGRGYLTIIRRNWHLLGYGQLLELLDWSAEKLAYTLKEDDCLWIKLGRLKPSAERIEYRPLTAAQAQATAELRSLVEKHFPGEAAERREPAFAFVERFRQAKGPCRPKEVPGGFDLRMVYPYFANYGDPLMEQGAGSYPDGILAALSRAGINAVWLQGILYTLVPLEGAPELSAGHETRLENLRALTKRAAKYGIGVFLYLNEPRGMPLSFFEKFPAWKGVIQHEDGVAGLCTSHPPVLEFVRRSTEAVFRQVPDLAGAFAITMSENLTNCYSRRGESPCPKCSQRPPAEVIAEVNGAMEEGVHAGNPDARFIAWAWGWNRQWAADVIDRLPDRVELMCTSEEAIPTNVGGVPGAVLDYTISQVGPGPVARELWAHAQKRGLKTVAKMQWNLTWECSAVPYLPVPDLVAEHVKNVRDCGVTGLMAAWTLGGWPGGNLGLLLAGADELAVRRFGEKAAPVVRQAERAFGRAFREFPFHIGVVYFCPVNFGPMNLLHARPSGHKATMIGFPHDDLKTWRSIYPEEVFEQQLRKLSDHWRQGLEILTRARELVDEDGRENLTELERVALGAYCHFRTTYLQTAFVRTRDQGPVEGRPSAAQILDEEIELARTLHELARQDSRIGFEIANHYYYTLNDLKEKVLNCETVRRACASDGGTGT